MLKVGWPGGKKFYKLVFLLLRFRFHDLCAVKEKGKGEGEGEVGKGVRLMKGKEYVDGGRWVGSRVWQDTMMVWMNMFVFKLLH